MSNTNKYSARIWPTELTKLWRTMCFRIGLSGCAVLVTLAASQDALGQCDSCNGRCNYCVDQQCYPRRLTFGHWETHWRRWPVPPPAVGLPEVPSPTQVTPEDLPAVEEESSSSPDFSRRRKKASGPPAVEEPLDIQAPSPLKPDPFRDDLPSSPDFGRNELRDRPHLATQMSLGFASNPLRGSLPPEIPAVTIRASYDKQRTQPTRALPRHANPLRSSF